MIRHRLVASIVCLCLLLAQFAGAGLASATEAQRATGHAHHAIACDDAGVHAQSPECAQLPAPDGDHGACPMSTGACCPGLAAALPRVPGTAVPGTGDEPIAFRSSLHLLSRAEGIFRPPRPIS